MALDVKCIRNQVKGMIALQGWTLTRVVEKMNQNRPETDRTTVQNVSNKLSRGTIKYYEILEIAEIIGVNILWARGEHRHDSDLADF